MNKRANLLLEEADLLLSGLQGLGQRADLVEEAVSFLRHLRRVAF